MKPRDLISKRIVEGGGWGLKPPKDSKPDPVSYYVCPQPYLEGRTLQNHTYFSSSKSKNLEEACKWVRDIGLKALLSIIVDDDNSNNRDHPNPFVHLFIRKTDKDGRWIGDKIPTDRCMVKGPKVPDEGWQL